MVRVVDSLGPSEEAVDDDLEPGLLERLAHDGLVQRLAPLHPSAGHRPLPRRRPAAPPHEQERVGVDAHRADGDLGTVHARPADVEAPVHHERAGGEPVGLEEVLGRAVAGQRAGVDADALVHAAVRRRASFTIASPTPTARASSSTNRSVTTPRRAPERSGLDEHRAVADDRVVDGADDDPARRRASSRAR